MPKGKRKGGGGGGGRKSKPTDSHPPSEEECDTPENWSTASVLSEDPSIPEEGSHDSEASVEDVGAHEDFEDKLKECIEGTMQKSAQGRKTALEGIIKAFSNKYLFDFLMERKVTVSDCVGRCLKKGKGDEQAIAAKCCGLICIQLGQDAEDVFSELKPILLTVMLDNSAAYKARAECAIALAICSFIASSDIEHVMQIMDSLEDVFKSSYKKGDDSVPNLSPELYRLHSSALSAWTLLLSISPPFVVSKLVSSHLPKLPDLLHSNEVELRIVAGEAIALMYELAREEDEDFMGYEIVKLCEILKNLATDSHKYRAKKDRRQQRSSFRDILRTIEEWEYPDVSVKFGRELLEIDTWVRKKQYDCMCQVLGSGIYQHLQDNTLVREVFGLGAPIPVSATPSQKPTKWERTMYNAAMFKARTKARAKHRDKRSVIANGGD